MMKAPTIAPDTRVSEPSTTIISNSIELLMMVVLGSLTRVSGAIVGAFIITVLPVAFEHFEDYKTLVFGVTMVVIMKFMPSGLVDGVLSLGGRFGRRKTGPRDDGSVATSVAREV